MSTVNSLDISVIDSRFISCKCVYIYVFSRFIIFYYSTSISDYDQRLLPFFCTNSKPSSSTTGP